MATTTKKTEPKQEKFDFEKKATMNGVPTNEADLTSLVAAILKGNQELQERFLSLEEQKTINEAKTKAEREKAQKTIDAKAKGLFEEAQKHFQNEKQESFIGEEYLKEFFGIDIKFSINGVIFEIPLNGETHKLPKTAIKKAQRIVRSRMSKVNVKEKKEYDGQLFRPKE